MHASQTRHVWMLVIIVTVALWAVLASCGTGVGTSASPPTADSGHAAAPPPDREGAPQQSPQSLNPNPPSHPVKLVFIHHSTGEAWLEDGNGNLGIALRDNNYFVSDTNYGWGPTDADVGFDTIGDHTDIGHWYNWFAGPHRNTYLSALYAESGQNSSYSRLGSDPGGQNEIIMFKSCFPNSNLGGEATDPPTTGNNPLRGQDAGSEYHTVGNAKGIYNDILAYFATRQDKLFVVIAAPPLRAADTDPTYAANARAFNNWLVGNWLASYAYNNVAVFDFYNVLTSNGGNSNTNDLGSATGNHHRWWGGAIQHVQTVNNNYSAYGSGDSHPTAAGNQKATGEFVTLLNVFYNRWKGTPAGPTTTRTPTALATQTRTRTATRTPTSFGTATRTPTRTATINPATLNRKRFQPVILSTYAPPASTNLDVTLRVRNTLAVARSGEPVTSGVPIPRSLNLTSLALLHLLGPGGTPVPAQFTALARWGGAPNDASKPVRWLLVDFQADVPASGSAQYRLLGSGGALPTFPTLNVTENASAVTIQTGTAQFSISKSDGRLTAPHLTSPLHGRAIDAGGQAHTTTGPVSVTVALRGPMRVSVHVQGAYRNAGGTVFLNYTSRYWFYAGQSTVRLFHTVQNDKLCPLGEYEQLECFDIGGTNSVNVADISLVLNTDLTAPLTYYAGGDGTTASGGLSSGLVVYQDSSGNEHWNLYPTLTDWEGAPLDTRPRMQSYVSFRGYRTTLGSTVVDSGHHAQGWLSIAGGNGGWTVGVRDFWQNFPKALRAYPNKIIEIGLFPTEFGPTSYAFNLRPGEHKTHEIILSPTSPQPPPMLPSLFGQAPAAWYVDSGAFGQTALINRSTWPEHEQYVDDQLTTSSEKGDAWEHLFDNLFDALEGTDFYGIFDYGDWPLDYEGYEVAPLNPKYDNDQGAWLQWARGGDSRWFQLAEALDRHTADIDILHNRHSPRHWGDGIIFGHSGHDEPGFTNPHRNANSGHPDIAFGVNGMLLTYYLTGYEKAYQSALELADCIEYRLHNDDHLCSLFPAGTCNGLGWALGDGLYSLGERPAANNLSIAVAAYRATADVRYLTVADALVHWARASAQPYINGPTGQDLELRPWTINLYLRALASYIEARSEFGLADTYNARGSFLSFANFLHTYAWIDLSPIASGPRAAYPYNWWFDGRTGIPGEDNDNGDPAVNNWLVLGADAMAYAYHLSGQANYLDWAARLFRTGSHDPWFEDDPSMYSETKQTINSISFGHTFLYKAAGK